MGLFGVMGDRGIVKNVGVINSCFGGFSAIGSVVGANCGCVLRCFASDNTVRGEGAVGGLVGQNLSGASIQSCYATGTVADAHGNYELIILRGYFHWDAYDMIHGGWVKEEHRETDLQLVTKYFWGAPQYN